MSSRRASNVPSCIVCGARGPNLACDEQRVRSNVRAYRDQDFAVWRCAFCHSLHARDAANLSEYYVGYPFFKLPRDGRLRLLYDVQLRRLRRAHVHVNDCILDYGAGAGHFVQHLRERGYINAFGYDEYSSAFRDLAVLERRYRCVVSQDVLEHVADPCALLDTFDRLVEPGGIIAIGTPNADAIDLKPPEPHIHALHMPYHRHILSRTALLAAGERRGWRLERYYPTSYGNTLVPFMNSRFYLHYMRCVDDTLDCLMEPPRAAPLLRHLARSLFWGLCGYFLAPRTDVMAVFRRP